MTEHLEWLRAEIRDLETEVPLLLENNTWTNENYRRIAKRLEMYKAIEADLSRGEE